MNKAIKGKPIVPGEAQGQAVVSHQPISFWGGVDPSTGEVIDRRHECSGTVITGKIFVFPTGKGSSTGSAVLMESIRNGSAPAAIINCKTDPILALGAIVAEELYHKTLPMVVVSQEDIKNIQDGDNLIVQPDGTILVNP
ncbi:MAG: aconitase X swivel domain-containing protein [Chloroflexota bacterium]